MIVIAAVRRKMALSVTGNYASICYIDVIFHEDTKVHCLILNEGSSKLKVFYFVVIGWLLYRWGRRRRLKAFCRFNSRDCIFYVVCDAYENVVIYVQLNVYLISLNSFSVHQKLALIFKMIVRRASNSLPVTAHHPCGYYTVYTHSIYLHNENRMYSPFDSRPLSLVLFYSFSNYLHQAFYNFTWFHPVIEKKVATLGIVAVFVLRYERQESFFHFHLSKGTIL